MQQPFRIHFWTAYVQIYIYIYKRHTHTQTGTKKNQVKYKVVCSWEFIYSRNGSTQSWSAMHAYWLPDRLVLNSAGGSLSSLWRLTESKSIPLLVYATCSESFPHFVYATFSRGILYGACPWRRRHQSVWPAIRHFLKIFLSIVFPLCDFVPTIWWSWYCFGFWNVFFVFLLKCFCVPLCLEL